MKNNNKPVKVVFCAGGTGGHIYPAIAVALRLKQNNRLNEIFFFVSGKEIEKSIFSQNYFFVKEIPSAKAADFFSIKFPISLLKSIIGFFVSFFELSKIKPDVIVSMGAYSSIPSVIAAWFLRIPIILHEQNAVVGKANKFLSRFAKKIALSFEESAQFLQNQQQKLVITGNPVREEFLFIDKSKKNPEDFTILVLGGSQGSMAINSAVVDMLFLEDFQKSKIKKIIHITGYKGYRDVLGKTKLFRKNDFKYEVLPYAEKIWQYFSEADLVISRAGATAISEIIACSLPSILIPYPYAAENHQQKNAEILEKNGAAIVLLQEQLSAKALLDIINSLKNNADLLRKMSVSSGLLFKKNAVKDLIQIIYGTA